MDMCQMDMEHFDNPNLSVDVPICWYLGSVAQTELLCV